MRNVFLALIVALGLAWGLAPAAQAQGAGPDMTVSVAFGGNFKYGEWLPISADITNPGADVNARLSVRINGSMQNTVFELPVELPSGAHKQVTLHVLPNSFTRILDVRLLDGDKVLVSKRAAVKPNPNVSYMAGFVTAQRGALSLISGVTFAGQERARVLVDLPASELPERPEALGSFDLLVLNDVDTSGLTPKQTAALESWVSSGGWLVLGGGAGAQRTLAGLPQALQPVTVGGTTDVPASALSALAQFSAATPIEGSAAYALAGATPASGAQVLAGTAEQPLLVQQGLGNGRLVFVALDLTAAPFEGWSGTLDFWTRLIGGMSYSTNLPVDVSARQMRANNLYGSLMNIPSLDLPSIKGLALLLIVYVILVGPVNYLLLRRMKRLHMAWVTIPAITVLFAAGAFGIGYALRGNDLILNRLAVVDIPASGPVRVTSFMGLFSPSRRAYAIEVKTDGLVSSAQPEYGGFSSAPPTATSEMTIIQGQPAVVQGLSVDQFSMQGFVTEQIWPDFGTITGKLTLQNDNLVGTVKNETGQPLTDVTLAVGRRFQRLGDLAVGQSVEVNLGMLGLSKDWMGSSLGYRIYMEQSMNAWQGRIPRDVNMKVNILDTLIEGAPWSKLNSGGNLDVNQVGLPSAVIFGWGSNAPPEVQVRGFPISEVTTTFVSTSLPIGLPESGVVSLPPGLLRGRLYETPTGFGMCSSSPTSIYLDNAEAVMEFQLPAFVSPEKLANLKIGLINDNPNASLPSLGVYNWQDQNWGSLSQPKTGTLIVSNPAAFVSPTGLVHIRLSNKQVNNGSCFYVDLGLETERITGQGG